jgi:preprotein translocase subunit SecE
LDSEFRKYTILSFFIFSAICGYCFYLFATQIADWTKIGGSNVIAGLPWPVVGGGIATLGGFFVFLALAMNAKATNFIDEVFGEVFKVTWPTQKELTGSTLVVTIMVLVAALVLAVMDYFWSGFFNFLLNKI